MRSCATVKRARMGRTWLMVTSGSVARTTETHAVVAAGLEPGETVVTDGQFRISPGAKVLVRGGGPGARP